VVLHLTLAPSQHHSPVGQEHGRTIPLADNLRGCLILWRVDIVYHVVPIMSPEEELHILRGAAGRSTADANCSEVVPISRGDWGR